MKPVPFDYAAPATVEEALALVGEGAVPLAGGQSLVPLLNAREVRPRTVVDLNGIASLSSLRVEEDGALRIGALVRLAEVERSPLVASSSPLLRSAVSLVAHPPVRSRGTVGGSVAHADPAAELPAVLLALGARGRLRSPRGARTLGIDELLLGPYRTALSADELLVGFDVPPPPDGARTALVEHRRTHGAFAVAGAAVVAAPGHATVVVFGPPPGPRRATRAEAALLGGAGSAEAAAAAGALVEDEYIRALTTELARRAIEEATA